MYFCARVTWRHWNRNWFSLAEKMSEYACGRKPLTIIHVICRF